MSGQAEQAEQAGGRIVALDLARAVALVGMAVYHLSFDLEIFGWLAPGTVLGGPLRIFAVCVASSFIFLAGVSLWLAHGQGIRWRGFWRRMAKVVGAALLVSAVTYTGGAIATSQLGFSMAHLFIYFGILHSIALSSLLGLAFLRWPLWSLAVLAVVVLVVPQWVDIAAFNPRWLAWTGLAATPPPSLDFEPLFPWFAPFLLGLAAGKLGTATGVWEALRGRGGPVMQRLAWPGRHSLLVYLLHQPVLIALVWLVSTILR